VELDDTYYFCVLEISNKNSFPFDLLLLTSSAISRIAGVPGITKWGESGGFQTMSVATAQDTIKYGARIGMLKRSVRLGFEYNSLIQILTHNS
jgi:hypothetical protein